MLGGFLPQDPQLPKEEADSHPCCQTMVSVSEMGLEGEVGFQKCSKEPRHTSPDKSNPSPIVSLWLCKLKGFYLFYLFQHQKPFANVIKIEMPGCSQYFLSLSWAHHAPSHSSGRCLEVHGSQAKSLQLA